MPKCASLPSVGSHMPKCASLPSVHIVTIRQREARNTHEPSEPDAAGAHVLHGVLELRQAYITGERALVRAHWLPGQSGE